MRPKYACTPFQPQDLAGLDANAEAAWTLAHLPAFETAEVFACHPSWSWWREEAVLCCAGVLIPWGGLGRLWALCSTALPQYPIVLRSVWRRLAWCIEHYQLHRVEADIRADFYQGRLLGAWLGLPLESMKPAYGPAGETFATVAWVRPKGA